MLEFLTIPTDLNLWPYCLLAVAVFFEGPITLLTAGAGIALGKLELLPALIALVIGNLTADISWYSLGRLGKMEWIRSLAKKFRIDIKSIEKLEETIHDHAPRLIFLSKFAIGLPIPTLIAIGLKRVSVKRWIVPLAVGEVVKSLLFISLGYFSAEGIQQTYGNLQVALWILTALIIIAISIYIKIRKKRPAADYET